MKAIVFAPQDKAIMRELQALEKRLEMEDFGI